jgi:thiamine-phosphate pyrophosphorylase
MKALARCRLYTFIDTAYLRGRDPAGIARQLCAGGSDLIQLRAKNCAPDQIRRMAEQILPIVKEAGVGLVINDHYEVAREAGAELCHLGQEDFFEAGLTRISQLPGQPGGPRVGLSSHTPEEALRALAAGAAYIGIGPVYATATKPGTRPVTLDYVRWAAANVNIPWFAIGGIDLTNLGQVVAAGARGVCAVSAILNAPDIAEACRQFRACLKAAGA